MIGKSIDELVLRWNQEHPEDLVEEQPPEIENRKVLYEIKDELTLLKFNNIIIIGGNHEGRNL